MKIARYCGPAAFLLAGVVALLLPVDGHTENEQDNVHFSGTLVADPCVVAPGDEEVTLDFGGVVSKYLYLNGRTPGQPFTLRLSECNPAISAALRVRFSGNQSVALPGRLALDTGSSASGVAIGLETPEGAPISLDDPTQPVEIEVGEMSLQYQAYVQGEPEAITAGAIGAGSFTATATFSLEYE